MSAQYQVTLFRAEQLQKLRNVRVHSPSLIQIMAGSKRLFWKESVQDLSSTELLLCEASASLSFENLPQKGRFLSRVFTFHCSPTEAMLELSSNRACEKSEPFFQSDKALQSTLNALFSLESQTISGETQRFWVLGLYQQLAEKGVLHQLFPSINTSFRQQLSRHLSRSPSDKHSLDDVAEQFAMSRATMIRKLKREGTQFREVLTEVRLAHALYLIQSGYSNVAQLALACGYLSEGRFSQRFKEKFGLTPTDYIKTVAA
ncbi:helix-turn-helix transcriptional regulator [Vibrio sp. Isolate30]|uniref:helix-turn-helix transcriptional regulator n=1 Tax=Vibrio sp. Isolate30 TaxID=2908536 RepID=UPI001EFEEC36|nr:helix-turn-helix transcriptional regulator [Vibrio sp. Isolate30]MCG9629401.1 helix-turn-helix transcriptional regulator [Vibrio sp. Isolate30]